MSLSVGSCRWIRRSLVGVLSSVDSCLWTPLFAGFMAVYLNNLLSPSPGFLKRRTFWESQWVSLISFVSCRMSSYMLISCRLVSCRPLLSALGHQSVNEQSKLYRHRRGPRTWPLTFTEHQVGYDVVSARALANASQRQVDSRCRLWIWFTKLNI